MGKVGRKRGKERWKTRGEELSEKKKRDKGGKGKKK